MKPIEYAIIVFTWIGLAATVAVLTFLFFGWITRSYSYCIKHFAPVGIFHSLRFFITVALCGKRWKEWCALGTGYALHDMRKEAPELWARVQGVMDEKAEEEMEQP